MEVEGEVLALQHLDQRFKLHAANADVHNVDRILESGFFFAFLRGGRSV
jgi:hypothetical protein